MLSPRRCNKKLWPCVKYGSAVFKQICFPATLRCDKSPLFSVLPCHADFLLFFSLQRRHKNGYLHVMAIWGKHFFKDNLSAVVLGFIFNIQELKYRICSGKVELWFQVLPHSKMVEDLIPIWGSCVSFTWSLVSSHILKTKKHFKLLGKLVNVSVWPCDGLNFVFSKRQNKWLPSQSVFFVFTDKAIFLYDTTDTNCQAKSSILFKQELKAGVERGVL